MRILQVVQRPQRRGAEILAYQLSDALRRRGHAVSIVYLYPYAGECALPFSCHDRSLEGNESHLFERFPGVHPRLVAQLAAHVRRYRPDVVQVNGGRCVKYGAAVRALDRVGAWILVYRNIGDPRQWLAGSLRKWFYRRLIIPRLNGVVGVSWTTLQAAEEIYGLTIPTVCIPQAVDPASLVPDRSPEDVRRSLGTGPESQVLIYVGSLTAEKRLDRLLESAHRLAGRWPDLRVWIVGDGPLRRRLELQVAALGIDGRIHFLGVQPRVADFLAAADLLVLSSDTEGIPGATLEAGLLGVPSVATRVGGIAEAVVDAETGLLVDPQDGKALTEAINELLSNPERRRALGEEARKRVRTHFLLDQAVEGYEDFYFQLMVRPHS